MACILDAQVQRCSGAFMVSARRASLGLAGSPGSALKTGGGTPGFTAASPLPHGSPFHAGPSPVGAAAGAQETEEEMGELAEDEEYAVEEHAHRCRHPAGTC